MSTGSAGLYNIAFMFGSIIGVISDGINKAYVPISMSILSANRREEVDHLKNIVLFLVVMYCLLGTMISLFSKEAIYILTTEAFFGSSVIVPFLVFYFVLGGIYYILVNILFFVKRATKFVAVGTGIGAVSNIVLSWWMIPRYGLFGAAAATLLSQMIGTLFIGMIGRGFEIIRWEYKKFFSVFILSATCSFFFIGLMRDMRPWSLLWIKIIAFIILFFLLNLVAWRDPFFLLSHGKKIFFEIVKR
jgi:O-antigen/teichoic acid export membrane protein